MIVFDLKCEHNHQFESWFRSSSAYEEQRDAGLVECPYCGSTSVVKALMAPNVATKGNQKSELPAAAETPTNRPAGPEMPGNMPVPAPMLSVGAASSPSPELKALAEKAAAAMAELQTHVEKSCENVGDNFAEEARKIHYGESEERGIYGESSLEEAEELLEEGIDIMPLPGSRPTDA